jgi:RNA polymerase sigma factor (sigma-70 family)
VCSPQPASVIIGDTVEVLSLALLGTPAEREQWLERRTADFGNTDIYRGPTASPIWCVAQSIAATWASRPEVATEWARTLQSNQLNPWADQAALWLTARTENDDVFAERVEPLSRDGIPDIPILDALIHLDLAQRSTGAVKNAARTRTEQTLTTFGGERLLATLFEPDTRSVEANAAQTSVLATLSDREREIATLLLEGLSYAQIGKELFITRSTVSFHLTRIYAKTGTTSRHELAQATHNATRAPRHRANS